MTNLTVHGRASINEAVGLEDDNGNAIDISTRTIYFEVPAVGLRVLLEENPSDALGLLLRVPRAQVELIPEEGTPFAFVDETNGTYPEVLRDGFIFVEGYKGEPS